MKSAFFPSNRSWPPGGRAVSVLAWKVAIAATLGALCASCVVSSGSGGQPNEDPCKATRTTIVYNGELRSSSIQRVDLLLDIDNSPSMADKQQLLALAVPDLVRSFVNPPCINTTTGTIDSTPDSPSSQCPAGTERRSQPVSDLHVGIVSSSLGGHGADACDPSGPGNASRDDKGRLLDRLDPATLAEVETYQGLHFLAWDPEQALTPPGEADLDQDSAADANNTALVPQLRDMVIGVGQMGCGYESQLESWYRFLVDPAPPASLTVGADQNLQANGVDQVLLDQRKAFLRPDSMVEIVMLTDENDCSIRESGQFYLAAQLQTGGSPFHLPRPRSECAQDPSNECCFSCGQTGPTNADGTPKCAEDPSCKTPDGQLARLDATEDGINVRCFDQKRRFGIDFLYGTDRYVQALSSPTVTDRNGEVVPNPLFADLDPSDDTSASRTPDMVYLAGIVGVPWQDIARTDANGAPDLVHGRDMRGAAAGGFKNADELAQVIPTLGVSTWDVILGNPEGQELPLDPLMRESIDARGGVNPITHDALVLSSTPLGNPINGHEHSAAGRNDLQYACIFPIVQVDVNGNVSQGMRDCSQANVGPCDCADPNNDSPLCQVNPSTGLPTDQVRAKAYPALRELSVLKGLGAHGIVGSACPAQTDDPAGFDFGYRAAVAGLTDRLQTSVAGQCLPAQMLANEHDQVSCAVIEARVVPESQVAACNQCEGPARDPVQAVRQAQVDQIQQDHPGAGFNCFCEVSQVTPYGFDPNEPMTACQYDPASTPVGANGEPADGFCYIGPAQGIGDPALVDKCPDDEKQMLRFVGAGQPKPGATFFMYCATDEVHHPPPQCEDNP